MAKATRIQWADPTGNAAIRGTRVPRPPRRPSRPRPWQAAGPAPGMQPAAVQRVLQLRRTGRDPVTGKQEERGSDG